MSSVMRQGFIAGYKNGPRGREPNPPKKLSKDNRLVWLELWPVGSALGRRHMAELMAAVEKHSGMKEIPND